MILKAQHITLFGFVLIVVMSCGIATRKMNAEEYLKWYSSQDFRWKASDTLQEIQYAVRFIPKEIELAQCISTKCKENKELKKELKEKNNYWSFMLELKSSSPDIFKLGKTYSSNEMLTYLNAQVKQDIKGITLKGDTIDCVSSIYEPLLSDRIRLLIAFESSNDGLEQILFQDKLFSNTKLKFNFLTFTNKSIPKLKI